MMVRIPSTKADMRGKEYKRGDGGFLNGGFLNGGFLNGGFLNGELQIFSAAKLQKIIQTICYFNIFY